jgi:hypothetical protein
MYVPRAISAADPAYSCVQTRTAPETAGRSTSSNGLPCRGRPRELHRAGLRRILGMLRLPAAAASPCTCCLPAMRAFHVLPRTPRHRAAPSPPRTRPADANASDRSWPARERHHTRDAQRASLAELRIERVPVERFRFEHGDLSVPARTLRPDMAVVAALADPGRAVLVPPRRPLLADTTLPLLALTHLGDSLPRTSSPAWH